MTIGIIIQARLGSTRLPKKILKPFNGKTILLFLIERLQQLELPIVVATTNNSNDDELCDYLSDHQIAYYRGDENNVLERYIGAASYYNFDTIIRICSDSPLIDLQKLESLVDQYRTEDCDYFSFSYKNVPTVLTHFGIFGEIVRLEALRMLDKSVDDLKIKEHVTYGIYTDIKKYKVKLIAHTIFKQDFERIRLTIDTQEDYENLLSIGEEYKSFLDEPFEKLAEQISSNEGLLKRMERIMISNKK
jgi:spore coat polysaccharide biosynthesis protein SpsF